MKKEDFKSYSNIENRENRQIGRNHKKTKNKTGYLLTHIQHHTS
jgi:hypothetical protein